MNLAQKESSLANDDATKTVIMTLTYKITKIMIVTTLSDFTELIN